MGPKLVVVVVLLAFVALVAQRVRRVAAPAHMPAAAAPDELRALYLTPAGKYSADDIAANDRAIAGERYRLFQARHDFAPRSGDAICPITRTKADPECRWTIDGESYQFCCPPCIDELVRLAKTAPEQVRPAAEYVAP